ncbi:unnamed protein product [Nesidiocoris tenuis]|uniref:Glutamate decarboxylase n=1 Tax=Nesidiocoris tenuis TaxID=355587 RepID=A0A6H5G9M6_9HEMI|nr:unnamed protein product [Nesidiocoris tenuis]
MALYVNFCRFAQNFLPEVVGYFYKISYLYPHDRNGAVVTETMLKQLTDVLIDFVHETNDRKCKVLDFQHPEEMKKLLDLDIPEEGLPLQTLIDDCALTLKYQVRTGHPHFFNQLSCGLDLVSMAGEWLTATANTNMFTYEIAPVFILMESVVLAKMREIIGWNGGDSILAPGGSISNLYAFLAARHHMFPNYKEKGQAALGAQLVMFTSDQCHYSVKSCAAVCGLGTDNCVEVPSDEQGRMIVSELERLVKERKAKGQIPFFVNCTSGTTVLGAFDPINPIADICQKYNMWLHIDAAWGGGLLLSKKYRHPRFSGRITLQIPLGSLTECTYKRRKPRCTLQRGFSFGIFQFGTISFKLFAFSHPKSTHSDSFESCQQYIKYLLKFNAILGTFRSSHMCPKMAMRKMQNKFLINLQK